MDMNTTDHVDEILAQWRRERPDLEVWPMGVIGRISRLAHHIENRLNPVFEHHNITSGEFDVLATLRRSGAPYQLTPTVLLKSAMLTSGAMTNRLNRLEQAGFIIRDNAPDDRRSVLVSLTPAGLELVNVLVEDHVQNEQMLLAPYTEVEMATLAGLLRKLLSQFETE